MLTRRAFVAGMLGSGAALVSCASPIGTRRSGPGALRLVFYTDVHARTEWGTPKALAMATTAINDQQPDLVLAGGDLVTDGFQSSYESGARRCKTRDPRVATAPTKTAMALWTSPSAARSATPPSRVRAAAGSPSARAECCAATRT